MSKQNSMKESDSFLADLMATWLGILLKCEKTDGKCFIGRLKAIRGKKLFFEDKFGNIIMGSIDDLSSASPMIYKRESRRADRSQRGDLNVRTF